MEESGLVLCQHVGPTCYISPDAEEQDEFNGTKIIFIGCTMRKLLTRSVRPTQCEQTIGTATANKIMALISATSMVRGTMGQGMWQENTGVWQENTGP